MVCFCSIVSAASSIGSGEKTWRLEQLESCGVVSTHLSGGWWLLSARTTTMRPAHVVLLWGLIWLPYNMATGLPWVSISRKHQVGPILPFMTWLWKSHGITSIVTGLPKFGEKEHRSHHWIGGATESQCKKDMWDGRYCCGYLCKIQSATYLVRCIPQVP